MLSIRIAILIGAGVADAMTLVAQDTVGVQDRGRRRPATVADCITSTITMPDDYRYPAGVYGSGPLAIFSPDGKRFVVVLRHGNIEQNTNEYSILLFQTRQVFQSPTPEVLLVMSSSSNREAIKDVHWLADNEHLVFLGEHPDESRQLYSLDIRTRRLSQLTNETGNILSYSITPAGEQFAYVIEAPVESIFDQETRRGSVIIASQRLPDLLRGTKGGVYGGNATLWFHGRGNVRRQLMITDRVSEWSTVQPYLSPDGRYVAIALQAADVPGSWQAYSDPRIHLAAMSRLASSGYSAYSFLRRYVLASTTDGESHVLLNSPLNAGNAPEVTWLPDSRSVILGDVYLPLDSAEGAERKRREATTFSVEVGVPGGDIRKVGGRWKKVSGNAARGHLPAIVQREGMNTPPRIYAVALRGRREALLLDPNPNLKELALGTVETMTWQRADGGVVRGGLYYPVNYEPGNRYPLVIQTHGWEANKFRMCGPFPTGYAAQPLAGMGVVVLQSDEGASLGYVNTPQEAPGETASFEAAIDSLDRRGLIDRARVGILGFSRTGFHVKYALTHSTYHFAAAAYTDSFDGAYPTYLLTGAEPGNNNWEGVNGGLPFGDGVKLWLERDPSFNIEKVKTPLRIISERPETALYDYPWYAASKRLGKPVEMVMMPDGEHYLRKPSEQLVDAQGNVDWFCFWLKGYEDHDPAKGEQYARWRYLRVLRDSSTARAAGASQGDTLPQSTLVRPHRSDGQAP